MFSFRSWVISLDSLFHVRHFRTIAHERNQSECLSRWDRMHVTEIVSCGTNEKRLELHISRYRSRQQLDDTFAKGKTRLICIFLDIAFLALQVSLLNSIRKSRAPLYYWSLGAGFITTTVLLTAGYFVQ